MWREIEAEYTFLRGVTTEETLQKDWDEDGVKTRDWSEFVSEVEKYN